MQVLTIDMMSDKTMMTAKVISNNPEADPRLLPELPSLPTMNGNPDDFDTTFTVPVEELLPLLESDSSDAATPEKVTNAGEASTEVAAAETQTDEDFYLSYVATVAATFDPAPELYAGGYSLDKPKEEEMPAPLTPIKDMAVYYEELVPEKQDSPGFSPTIPSYSPTYSPTDMPGKRITRPSPTSSNKALYQSRSMRTKIEEEEEDISELIPPGELQLLKSLYYGLSSGLNGQLWAVFYHEPMAKSTLAIALDILASVIERIEPSWAAADPAA